MSWNTEATEYGAYLARFLASRGRIDEAQSLLSQSQQRLNTVSPEVRPDVYRWLGDAAQDLFRPEDAIKLYSEALEAHKVSAAPQLPTTYAYTVQNLASVQARLYDFDNAEKNYRLASDTFAAIKMPTIDVITFWNNLALFYLDAGCNSVAKDWAGRVVRHPEAGTLASGRVLAFSLRTLGRTQLYDHDFNGAVTTHRRAVEQAIASFGPRNWRVAQFKTYAADVAMLSESRREAITLIQDALDILNGNEKRPYWQYVLTLAEGARLGLQLHDARGREWLTEAENYLPRVPAGLNLEPMSQLKFAEAQLLAQQGKVEEAAVALQASVRASRTPAVKFFLVNRLYFSDLEPSLSTALNDDNFKADWSAATSRIDCGHALVP